MKLSSGTLSLLTVLLLFVVLGAGIGWRLLSTDEGGSTSSQSELPETEGVEVESAQQFAGALEVEGVEVVRDTLWIPVLAQGQAEAYRESVVATRTEGIVQSVLVRENDLVQQGDILVQLDTVRAARLVAQAEAEFVNAQADYEAAMLGSDLAGFAVADSARAQRERIVRASTGIDAREQDLQQAREELEWTRVRAPFAGRVADLQAVEGAYLQSGGEVLTLLQLDPIKVQVNVGESELRLLGAGRGATVRFAGLPNEEFDARLESANPIVDPETRSGRVTLVLPNPGHRVKPGMWAQTSIHGQAYPDRILIPRDAVVERSLDRRDVVFMATEVNENGEGVAEWRYVTLGERNQTHVEIVDDPEANMLEPGEIVLVGGHQNLAHDVAIRLVGNLGAVAQNGDGG